MFGGAGFHATNKGAELGYKIGYFITAALYFPVCPYCQGLSASIFEVYLHRPHYELPRS